MKKTSGLDNSIRNSMLDELLSDEDKKSPTTARDVRHTEYAGQNSFDWGRGDSMPSSFFDDDGPDPMDDGYRGYSSRRSDSGGRTERSVFHRRTTHENVVGNAYGDWDKKVADVMRTVHRIDGAYVMENGERDEIVGILMKMIGVQLDKVGITWGTQGLKAFKEMLKDLVPMSYYGTSPMVLGEDVVDERHAKIGSTVYDRETGEVIGEEEDMEERLAIMEENKDD